MFKIYIGQNFSSSNLKVLFVGESHNKAESNNIDANFTVDLISNYLSGKWNSTFLNKLFKGFKSFLKTDEEKNFFEKIAFTNYVQDVLESPSQSLMPFIRNDEGYKSHFLNVVEALSPSHIVLLSPRLFEVWEYSGLVNDLKSKGISITFTHHPASKSFKQSEVLKTIKWI
jgi:hypothetical protein